MLVLVVSHEIDEARLLAAVQDPAHGAELVFRGVVRNHHAGRAVTHIDYHAYVEMAESELRSIAEGVSRRFAPLHLAVAHRIGSVQVAEASLVVAASGPHRRPVFEGVLEFVDELKRRVPVWKHEHGPDGASWVEGVRPEPA